MPEAAAHPALRTAALSRAYGERWALREVDLELPAGRTLAVIGPNGAGKSTLLRILASLLRPTDGSVEVLGCALPREAWRLRGRVGYLGHSALLYRDLTAVENLGFHAKLFGMSGEAATARIDELLEAVGLRGRSATRVGEMSAGMVQRLAVCRTVLHEPDLLVLDEPLANLDPGAAETVAPLIGPAPGRTRVIVTHDLEAAIASSDRVLALGRGGRAEFLADSSEVDPGRARSIYSDAAVAP